MNRSFPIYLLAWSLGLLSGMVSHPPLLGQEVILPPGWNPHAADDPGKSPAPEERKAVQSNTIQLIELPLFDDFATGGPAPDQTIWSDRDAYVNNHFCIDPVSNGVATLDALTQEGNLYPGATLSPSTFIADHLTSRPVNLDYSPADSIYLSFLYQPGGLGDQPEGPDSLAVDFYAPDSARWYTVWQRGGGELQPFRQVMIPVREGRYLQSGFRFRFRNRASLSRSNDYPDLRNNVDFWNIDYVRLGSQRFAGDTVLRDVAFHEPLSSILKTLSALPWDHFEAAYNTVIDPPVEARYRNNDTITRNVTRSLLIEEPYYGRDRMPEPSTAQDLPASEDTSVVFNFIYPLDFERGDSALIRLKASLRTDAFDPKVNDTVIHDQYFRDYYAYDDGTAEAGYGLRGSGTANGLVAVRFNSYLPDQLGGVYLYFNQVYDSLNLDYYFDLLVWDDNEGVPGNRIWEDDEEYRVRYSTAYPGFVKYEFSRPVEVDGPFYVGWRQYNEYLLNVGLDLNNPPSPQVMYYNIQGVWEPSDAPGVILIRPYLYREPTGKPEIRPGTERLLLFPNPVSDRLHLKLPPGIPGHEIVAEVFDTSGRLLQRSDTGTTVLEVSSLPSGIYHLRVRGGGRVFHSKFLIHR